MMMFMKSMVGDDAQLTEEQLGTILRSTFDQVDTNNDGLIDRGEYMEFCKKHPEIIEPFTIPVDRILNYDFEKNRRKRKTVRQKDLKHGILEPSRTETGQQIKISSKAKKNVRSVNPDAALQNVKDTPPG